MSKDDTKRNIKQEKTIVRERIVCLKRVIRESQVKKEVDKRRLDQRMSPKCPAHLMVWFTIAIWFYGDSSYKQVFRWLHRFSKQWMPSSSALTQARAKIGIGILADLYHRVVQCLCSSDVPGAYYFGLRLVAVDGFVLNLYDSQDNRQTFGKHRNGSSEGAFPQLRIVALCEVGSRVLFSFLAKPIRCGEITLAKGIYRDLPEKSLLLFDIGFCAYVLMKMVVDQNSHFLGRSKTNRRFAKLKILSDGSYLSKIYATDYDRLHDRNGTWVRVIEYTLDDPERVGHGEKHRLVTTLLDERQHPAETLIVLYHQRWEEELAIDEIKTHLRNSATLRSHRPAGVIQEVYGMFIAHFIIRKLAFEAAQKAEIAPRQISFKATVNVLQARLPEAPKSRYLIEPWYQSLLEEISLEQVEKPRNRINPRVIKRPQSKWPKKQEKHRNLPNLQHTFHESIVILT